ncbi:hypothetical protein AB5I41_31420 [Sphingomonas sp. MMS24-JH45]
MGTSAFLDSYLDAPRHMMDSPFFAPLTYWMPQWQWGIFAFIVGAVRIGFLIVNGITSARLTSLRAIGAGLSAVFWSGMASGALSLSWSSGAVWTYGGWMLLYLISLYRAAREVPVAFANASGRWTTLSIG